ncbi:MAG: sigma-54-dependent transcriptional regulator [Candidatus Sumerlaeaceae bacterium]
MSHEPRLLVAEDEERLRRLLEMLLSNQGYQLTMASDGTQAWAAFQSGHFDLVITDLRMPNMDGMELLKRVKAASPQTPIVVITAFGTIESAVDAMRAGALDYITKPFEEAKLKFAIDRALSIGRILGENQNLRREIRDRLNLDHMVAESAAMKRLLDVTHQVAGSNATVLVHGESGTGKELITRAIHDASPRSHSPFVAINCAAIPDNLLESELFGHEKGSFTGATERKVGKFEMADGGSLFLDEIGEMNIAVQAKVLRAIEQQEFQRVGGTKTIRTDIRFICATNKDLRRAVSEGKFREDLFFRVNVFPIEIPPLRQRRDDILPLARFFLAKFCREMGKRVPEIEPATQQALLSNSWQGNVRELQNSIERATILLKGSVLTARELGLVAVSGWTGSATATPAALTFSSDFVIPDSGFRLEDHERGLLLQALERSGGNKSRAAKMLGLSRATLRYRLEKFGIADNEVEASLPAPASNW